MALMFSYLKTSKSEKRKIVEILEFYIETDKSQIVKVNSMQTLADIAMRDDSIKEEVISKFKIWMKKGSPAVVSRLRKMMPRLEQ